MLSWSVEVRDSSLARVGQLSEKDLGDGIICVPRVNTLGSWSIKLPNTVLNAFGVRIPHALCAVLRTQGSGVIVTGPNGYEFTGDMLYANWEATSADPDGQWSIEGVSDMVVMAGALAFPQPSNSDPSTQTVSNDVRTGLGEALMRAYVSANIGPTASTARKLTDLTLAADGGLGISLSKSPRFQNLLELTQEIAVGSSLLFDVVQVGAGRQFQVSAPVDVSAAVRWDIANNQLSRSKYGYSAPGCTRVFVAGQGEGTARTIVEVTTAASLLSEAIWGRIERFVDQRNTNDVAELTQAGLEILAVEGSTVTSLEVVPSTDMADGFGTTWFLGSWVTIVVNDQEVVAQVTEVPISISSAGTLIGAVVGDSTGFDWESILSARQQKTESRVSALEQNAESGATVVGTPTGVIAEFAGASAPAGYVMCNGGSYATAAEPGLFAVIGYLFGGSGSNFNVPNHSGRVGVGKAAAGTFATLGSTGGAETHTLTTAESPSHTHVQNAHNHTQNAHNHIQTAHNHFTAGQVALTAYEYTTTGNSPWNFGSGGPATQRNVLAVAPDIQNATAINQAATATNQNTGGGGAHNNLQPFIVLNFIIKT